MTTDPVAYWATVAQVVPVLALAVTVELRFVARRGNLSAWNCLYWLVILVLMAVVEFIALRALAPGEEDGRRSLVEAVVFAAMAMSIIGPSAVLFVFLMPWLRRELASVVFWPSIRFKVLRADLRFYRMTRDRRRLVRRVSKVGHPQVGQVLDAFHDQWLATVDEYHRSRDRRGARLRELKDAEITHRIGSRSRQIHEYLEPGPPSDSFRGRTGHKGIRRRNASRVAGRRRRV